MIKKEEKGFVPVANKYFYSERLTPNELYLFYYLYASRSFYCPNICRTNLNLIASEVKFLKKVQDNRDRIVESLLSLEIKGVIFLSFNDSNLKKASKIDITFPIIEKGFEKIQYSIYDLTTNAEEFMVLCAVKTLKKSISAIEFSAILNCSERHVTDLIKKMEEKGLLNVNSGRHYVNENNQVRQEVNSYTVNEDQDSENINHKNNSNNAEEETRPSNWGNKEKKLTTKDYYVYLTTKDLNFKTMVERIIYYLENPSDTSKRPFDFSKMRSDAELMVEKERAKSIINGVYMEGDATILPVTCDNIDNIDFSKVSGVMYSEGGIKRTGDFSILANDKENSSEMEFIYNQYISIVKENRTFNNIDAKCIKNEIIKNSETLA